LNHSHASLEGKQLDLALYSINDRTKARYWVAKINNAFVISAQDATKIIGIYRKEKWLSEMKDDLRALGLTGDALDSSDTLSIFNMRYRVDDLVLFSDPIQFDVSSLPSARYGTLQEIPDLHEELRNKNLDVSQLKERNDKALRSKRSSYASEIEVDLVHKRWQAELKKNLKREFPSATIRVEPSSGNPIDVIIELNGKKIFIELKTINDVKKVIRSALGQLLEYSYRPPLAGRATILVITGSVALSADDDAYLRTLREEFHLPIHYRRYLDGTILGLKSLIETIVA
jgi:hypothetical protein